jgi:hypothetical protein
VRIRLLHLLVVTPLGVLGRPLWRRRVPLGLDRSARSYWRPHPTGKVTAAALRRRP